MDRLLIVIVWGAFVLMSCIVSTIFVYRKLNYSSTLLAKTIEDAEKDLFDDIKQADLAQLGQTQAGIALLALVIKEQPRQFIEADPPHPEGQLDAAELVVLRMIAMGLSDQAIAERLYVSPRRVQVYRSSLMRKLGLPTLADVVRYALERFSTSDSFVSQHE